MKLHLGTYIKRKHKARRFIKKPKSLFGLWPPQLLELENIYRTYRYISLVVNIFVRISEASTLKQTTQRHYITLAKRRAAFQKKTNNQFNRKVFNLDLKREILVALQISEFSELNNRGPWVRIKNCLMFVRQENV